MSPLDAFVRIFVYPVPWTSVPEVPPAPLKLRLVKLDDGNKIVSWIWQMESDSDSVPVVLYFHGNGENLETMRLAGTFENFNVLKVHFIAMDYPGYGNSSGKPSEALIEKSADALLAWISQEFPGNPKFVCGWSLGAAVAIKMAAKHSETFKGLIAISPWTSLRDCATAHYPRFLVNLLVHEKYNSVDVAKRVKCPAIVLHGSRDQIIPALQGKTVADSLSHLDRLIFFPVSGHNDLLSNYKVWKEMSEFINK